MVRLERMPIDQIIFFLAPIFFSFLFAEIQQKKHRKTNECCICRRNIINTEEIVVCPFCQTIYHRLHLSLWLKIRKKCPICKNVIKNRYTPYYIDSEGNYSFKTNDESQFNLTLCENRPRANIRAEFVLECPYCKNILNSWIYGVSSQCKVCGSHLSWNNGLESRIKNFNELIQNKKKRFNRARLSGMRERNERKVNYRIIKRQKEKKQERFRGELQKQAQLESQDQMLLLNQDYLRRQTQQPSNRQNTPLKIIELGEKKENLRRKNFIGLESVITLVLVIAIFILVTI